MSAKAPSKRAIWLAGVAAIMPVAVAASPALTPQVTRPTGFAPPAAPMLLTRTLRRPLPGGAEIRTQRRYEIRFVSDDGGFRIDGRLVDVAVDAPPALRALAALERARPDDDMFPMRLDANGRLLPKAEPDLAGESRKATSLTLQKVHSLGLDRPDARQAEAFISQFETRPGRTPWPDDLFNPAPGNRRETRTIPMPNGERGTVAIDIEAHTAGSLGLLARFERKVTTELGGNARVTEETWTLSSLS